MVVAAAGLAIVAISVYGMMSMEKDQPSMALANEKPAKQILSASPTSKEPSKINDRKITSTKTVPVSKKTKPRSHPKQKTRTEKSMPAQNQVAHLPDKNKPSLPELIKIKGSYKPIGNGVAKPQITVMNNSDESLRVVAVNVVYYKADGSMTAKEILYFKNLSPGQSITLKAPSNPKAEEVKFRLGLVSSKEGEIFYAMQ